MLDAMRLQVMDELIAELKSYGHYSAVTHVKSCRKRLMSRMSNDEIRHYASAKTANDATGQVEEAPQRIAV